MRTLILSLLVAGTTLLALPAPAAQAGTVEATIRDSYVNAGSGGLKGNWNANFQGAVGGNTATLSGNFNVTGGWARNWFGGKGASPSLSANLWNFHSNVTGANGIVTQSQFGGDIFAEAASYGASSSSWNPTNYISFHFDELFIQGVNGAYLAAGRGSTSQNVGKIYVYNGQLLVNFWMNRVTFNSPRGNQYVYSTGDWITVVLDHNVTGGEPVPEPSTWAMLGLSALGLGVWTRRRRRRVADEAAAPVS